jgi:uncharacterized membrane protein YccF (DUF307 family)
MASLQTSPAILELLAQLLKQVTALWTIEVDLVRAELAESSSRAMGGVAKVAAGAVFLLAGFFFLLAALTALLVRLGLPVDLSCLIVAVVALIAGGLLLRAGMSAFASRNLLPRRSIDQISSLIGRL